MACRNLRQTLFTSWQTQKQTTQQKPGIPPSPHTYFCLPCLTLPHASNGLPEVYHHMGTNIWNMISSVTFQSHTTTATKPTWTLEGLPVSRATQVSDQCRDWWWLFLWDQFPQREALQGPAWWLGGSWASKVPSFSAQASRFLPIRRSTFWNLPPTSINFLLTNPFPRSITFSFVFLIHLI